MAAQGGASITERITAISQLIFTAVFLLMFLGVNQKIQVMMWARDARGKLAQLWSIVSEAKRSAEGYLAGVGVSNPRELIDRVARYFMVQPVDIEPVDIIRRLERILRTREETIRSWIVDALPAEKKNDATIIDNSETVAEIAGALDTLYRLIRHLFIQSIKYNNWALMMQVVLSMPFILRVARSYSEAVNVVSEGRPIGDGVGPLVAFLLARRIGARLEGEAARDTVYYHGVYEGREVYIVKARGPGSNVGRPGEAVENLGRSLGDKLAAVITVDAMLKVEGEKTGEVAPGAGVAMGDPGPEKIRIERLAARLKIPVHAIGIKMSLEEAITGMRREIADAAKRAVDAVLSLIKSYVEEGKAVIVVGVGNTLGVAQ